MKNKKTKKELMKEINRLLIAIEKAHNQHMTNLSRFMIHDIKNSIQNMDSILTMITTNSFSKQELSDLKEQINAIRSSMDSFHYFMPNHDSSFTVSKLLNVIESLNRSNLNGIKLSKSLQNDITLTSSFHTWIQILNNLVINAIEHLKHECIENAKIHFDVAIRDNYFVVRVYDNGLTIPNEIICKIFELGFSTKKNGSGIGLFHIKHLCNLFSWNVEIKRSNLDEYTKFFEIKSPIELITQHKEGKYE